MHTFILLFFMFFSLTSLANNFYRDPDSWIWLDTKEQVWVLGNNDYAHLGIEGPCTVVEPTMLKGLPAIEKVFSNGQKTFFLSKDKDLWAVGKNSHGQLGLGHESEVSTPEKIPHLPPIASVDLSSFDRTRFIDYRGDVYFSGHYCENWTTSNSQFTPKVIEELSNISCSTTMCRDTFLTNYFISEEGNLWFSGDSIWGEGYTKVDYVYFATPHKVNNFPPIKGVWCLGKQYFLGKSGHVWYLNWQTKSLDLLEGVSNITEIYRSYNHLYLLDENKDLWKLGFETPPKKINNLANVIQVAVGLNAGVDIAFFLDGDGKVFAMGKNDEGQLGVGHLCNMVVEPEEVVGLPRIIQVKTNGSQGVFLDEHGDLWVTRHREYVPGEPRYSKDNPVPSKLSLPFKVKAPDESPSIKSALSLTP